MAQDCTKTPETATPVTITMDRDTFYRWLAEVQGITDPGTTPCNAPNFLIEQYDDEDSPYCKVEGYVNTVEGTVIARHHPEGMVEVTMRCEKPGPQLMRTVRWMIGEEDEAA
ncbi:hypothetical protein [Neotabrizicola sp. VNH66]|uniref:hypothetical protein n=1 Tax=Neotabrizicola sp. VNH66 TaxID=3400918 RepID=UPI003BFCDB9E